MVQFLSIYFFFLISSIFVGFFKSSRFFCVTLYILLCCSVLFVSHLIHVELTDLFKRPDTQWVVTNYYFKEHSKLKFFTFDKSRLLDFFQVGFLSSNSVSSLTYYLGLQYLLSQVFVLLLSGGFETQTALKLFLEFYNKDQHRIRFFSETINYVVLLN